MNKEVLLTVRGLKTYFYTYEGIVKALSGVNLDIGKSEMFGLVGETGCGKSVTALSILRLVKPPGRIVDGKVILDGENLMEKSENEMREIRGSRLSMIFQDPSSSLNPVLKIKVQLTDVMLQHQNLSKKESNKKAIELLRKVDIPSPAKRLNQYPHELSGGMKQRIMIAIALSSHPDLLIADEPTTNLDVTTQSTIIHLIKNIQEEYGSSVMLITHNISLIAQTCERVAVMYAGRVVESADKKTLFYEAKHPYTRLLLSAIPKMHEKRKWMRTIPGVVPSLVAPPSGCRFHPRCNQAKKICKREKPPEVEVEPGHKVACHLYC